MEPKNRFHLPVQSGEFVHLENGQCHILSFVEEWNDAPEDSSGYRGIFLYGLYIGRYELRERILKDRGFAELESEFKQSFAAEPIEQDLFDLWIDSNCEKFSFVPVSTAEFLEKLQFMNDGCFFVKFARGSMYASEIAELEQAWKDHKIKAKLSRPDASEATEWIRVYLHDRPELDAPWFAEEAFALISSIEEPSEPDHETHPFVGRRIRIVFMEGEPQYAGREGIVELVDDAGQLHGTWGGCAVVPGTDRFEWIEGDMSKKLKDFCFDVLGDMVDPNLISVNEDGSAVTIDTEDVDLRDMLREEWKTASDHTEFETVRLEFAEKPKYLTADGILDVIRDLSKSQGHWGRLLEEILESKKSEPAKYAEWAKGMEAKNFADALEVVLFFEEGQLPKACPKREPTYWSVPVVYEMHGSIDVEADSAEEAYDKVKAHPERFPLPDEDFYVEGSFRVADDDRESAIATIEELGCFDKHGPIDPK